MQDVREDVEKPKAVLAPEGMDPLLKVLLIDAETEAEPEALVLLEDEFVVPEGVGSYLALETGITPETV